MNQYVEVARELYRFWIWRNAAGQEEAHRKLALLFFEAKRRDPTLGSLYALLKEPDDFVRITAAQAIVEQEKRYCAERAGHDRAAA